MCVYIGIRVLTVTSAAGRGVCAMLELPKRFGLDSAPQVVGAGMVPQAFLHRVTWGA